MEPAHIRFGGGSPVTILHPLVALAVIVAILLIWGIQRKYVIIPFLLAIFMIPKGQVIVLSGIHLNIFRVIILAGLARWATSGRSSRLAGGFNFMDRTFVLFFGSMITISTLQWMDPQAFIKNAGDCVDYLGGYFLIRFLVRDREEALRTIKVLAVIAILNGLLMLNEQRTGENVLAFLGGVVGETVRDGKIRSQGSFEIFITAGTYGATLIPLLVALWSEGKAKVMSFLGILGATIMAITCFASTTLIAYAAGIGALLLWPIRKQMRLLRWGIVAMLVALHLVMHGPVWSLIEHIDLTGSSSSYHRYMLVDNFLRHIGNWWLLGTRENGSWGFDMWDASNQYVAYGFSGGLLTFIFFVALISRGFGRLGTARKAVAGNQKEEWFIWCLGATLFSHVVAFFGIGYFDQVLFSWFAFLAIISTAVFEATRSAVPLVREAPAASYSATAVSGWSL